MFEIEIKITDTGVLDTIYSDSQDVNEVMGGAGIHVTAQEVEMSQEDFNWWTKYFADIDRNEVEIESLIDQGVDAITLKEDLMQTLTQDYTNHNDEYLLVIKRYKGIV